MNELAQPISFDFHQLRSFLLVAEQGSFTGASGEAGLSQGSLSRQIAALEDQLGVVLFDRTTRALHLTEVGEVFLGRTRELLGAAQETESLVGNRYGDRAQTLRIGLSRSIGLAPLPGLFAEYRRRLPEVGIQVEQGSGDQLLEGLRRYQFEVAVMTSRESMPTGVKEIGRFEDPFVLIGSGACGLSELREGRELSWILPSEGSAVGRQLRGWLRGRGMRSAPTMETDDFDLAVSLVSLGIGVAFVPARVLPLYARRREVVKWEVAEKFSRELVIVARGNAAKRPHVRAFAEANLFSLRDRGV